MNDPTNLPQARAVTFCVVVFAELFRSLSARSPTLTLFQVGLITNPALLMACVISGLLQVTIMLIPVTRHVFDAEIDFASRWWLIAILAITPVTLVELFKLARRRFVSTAP